ncbi:5-formyltetrahydrofolate cyclo-ligase [Lunatimonas salinarum]|uniref:5-formyltetrahydrofolate cyclo-ligase n=1 Tax=Lunatimonas salinarum TaxID=1774590 RepID=UPI001AE0BE7F|nr:5-formyltetrahydrofolate cyclo-ligase [Lunatimonas salinarum]
MIEGKDSIRRRYKKKRADLGPEQRAALSGQLIAQAMAFLASRGQVRHIHLFLPIARLYEVDTTLLIDRLVESGRKLYTSVTDFSAKKMQTVSLVPGTKWEEDERGIPVPSNFQVVEHEGQIDLVFLPLLAFDLEGFRIGYGMGYYDQFLSRLPNGVLKVGLSYFPAEERLPREHHDVPMDACILPKEILYFIR